MLNVTVQAEAGNVDIVRAPWNKDWLAEIENFPPDKTGHDDQVDSASLAFSQLINAPSFTPWALTKPQQPFAF